MAKIAREKLIKNIAHKLGGLKEYSLCEVEFFVDYIDEREKKEIQLSARELAELKKTELEIKRGEYHTLEEL